MYAVIAVINGTYRKLERKPLTIDEARQFRDEVDQTAKPLIVSEENIDLAIETNNKTLE